MSAGDKLRKINNRWKKSGFIKGLDPTDTFYVGGSADDAYEYGSGIWSSTDPGVYVESDTDPSSNNYRCGGFRFPNVDIPKGTAIISAILSVYVYYSGSTDIDTEIYGNDVGNALDFVDNPHIIPIVNRPRTSAHVPWVQDSLGTGWKTKDGLESIIEEIVGHADWSLNNALVLLLIANVAAHKECWFYSYDKDSSYAAKLEVTWEEAAPPTGFRKLQYFTEPPTGGQFNKLRFASEPPVSGAYNKLLFEGE